MVRSKRKEVNKIMEMFEYQGQSVFEHCVLPEGKFIERGLFDKKEIGYDRQALVQMADNFKTGKLHFMPILNTNHTDNKVGEIVDLYYKEEGQKGLYAKIELDEDGQELLRKKKFRYLSSEIIHEHLDEKGQSVGYVFHGLALTNRPRHKRITKLYSYSEVNEMDEQKFQDENLALHAEVEKLSERLNAFQAELSVTKALLWQKNKLLEGHAPALVEKFVKMYGKISEEELDSLIGGHVSETKLEEQVYQKEEYVQKEKTLQEVAREDYKRITGGANNV